MDANALRKSYRNAWMLTLAAAVFILLAFLFTLLANTPGRPAGWNAGGMPFVPASSPYAEGYYLPVGGPYVTGEAGEVRQ